MSNYSAIVYDEHVEGRVRSWLDERSVPAHEYVIRKLSRSRSLLIVSKDVRSGLDKKSFFRGTAVSPESRAIAFGAAGWSRLQRDVADPSAVGGEFVWVSWTRSNVRIQRDLFGSVALLHTQGPGFIAVSDSMLILRDLRDHFALRSTQNDDILLARSFVNSVSAQQLSPSTYVYEIEFVPAGYGVRIAAGAEFFIEDMGRSMQQRLDVAGDTADAVRRAASFLVGVPAALTRLEDASIALDLSGGRDSRAVLGGVLAAGAADAIEIRTRDDVPAHARDAQVARAVASQAGFALSIPKRTPSGVTTGVWAGSSLGIYDRLLPDAQAPDDGGRVVLSGLGAEVFKGNFGWKTVAEMVEALQEGAARDALGRVLADGVRAVGGLPDTSTASEVSYLAYRNGLHDAAHTWSHLTGIRPLQRLDLAAIAHASADKGAGDAILVDILALTHISVAALPYDVDSKDLSKEQLDGRVDALGGPLTAAEKAPVAIWGIPSSVAAGPSQLSLEVARAYDLDISAEPETLLARADEARQVLVGEALVLAFEGVLDKARWRLVDKSLPPAQAGPSVAKILSLVVVGHAARLDQVTRMND